MRRMAEVAGSAPSAVIDRGAGTVTASVQLARPPERVWRMLVTAETERWWGSPETYVMRDWTSELRNGGSWRVVVGVAGGDENVASGEFVDYDPPGRIVQTRRYEWDHPTLGRRDTVVTYALQPRADGSALTVVHEGFRGLDAAADEHAAGWERVLGWLQTYARTIRDEEVRR